MILLASVAFAAKPCTWRVEPEEIRLVAVDGRTRTFRGRVTVEHLKTDLDFFAAVPPVVALGDEGIAFLSPLPAGTSPTTGLTGLVAELPAPDAVLRIGHPGSDLRPVACTRVE